MARKSNWNKVIEVHIDNETLVRLDKYADKRGIGRSTAIRAMVIRELEREDDRERLRRLELDGDL